MKEINPQYSLDWEALHGVQNLHNSGRTSLVLSFSSLWVAHLAGMGFDFNVIAHSYCLVAAPPLPLDMAYLFLVGSNILLSKVCSAATCNLGVLTGEDERTF